MPGEVFEGVPVVYVAVGWLDVWLAQYPAGTPAVWIELALQLQQVCVLSTSMSEKCHVVVETVSNILQIKWLGFLTTDGQQPIMPKIYGRLGERIAVEMRVLNQHIKYLPPLFAVYFCSAWRRALSSSSDSEGNEALERNDSRKLL